MVELNVTNLFQSTTPLCLVDIQTLLLDHPIGVWHHDPV
jgi:hypothetical protein